MTTVNRLPADPTDNTGPKQETPQVAAGPLKILLVIDNLGSGGAQRQMTWLAQGLAARGHKIALFNYYPVYDHFRKDLEDHDIEIIDACKRQRFDLKPILALRTLVRSRRFDVVISFLNTPNVYSVLASIGISETKVLVSERWMFADGRLSLATWARYQIYRLADAVTVNSNHQCDRIRAKFPWSHKKLSTIWNGVDLNKYSPIDATETGTSGIRLLAAATVAPWKNAYNLIQALGLAKQQGACVTIDWAGKVSPTAASSNEFARCEALIRQLGLQQDWRWLGECANMHDLYRQYDGLVHPSFLEGLPNVVCESLASGLPILASTIGDHPLLVKDGVNGWLFDPADPASAAKALIRFANLPAADREKMSRASRKLAEAELSIGKFIDTYESKLREMLQH